MISVQQAKNILSNTISNYKETCIPLLEALNDTLSVDIYSPINMPPFRQSAMDGYALNIHTSLDYKLIGEIKAGDAHKMELKQGEAIKIFTGAAVPDSANAVIQIEKTSFADATLHLNESVAISTNIRPVGEQIKENETRSFVLEGSTIPYILIHLENGEFRAYEQKCTHLSCSVFYAPGSGKIECPCHKGFFDAMTGEVLEGPPPRALPKLEVFFKENSVFVKSFQEEVS